MRQKEVLDLARRESRLKMFDSLKTALRRYTQREEALSDGLDKKALQHFVERVSDEIHWYTSRPHHYDSSLSDLLPAPAARAYAEQLYVTKLSEFIAKPLVDISGVLLGAGTQFKEYILYLHPEYQKK
jgi:hypothetical protein